MTIANVSAADFLNHHLKDLLEVDKSDRLRWFNAHLMPLLTQRDPEAFTDFDYTADLLDRLCDVALTSTPPTQTTGGNPLWETKCSATRRMCSTSTGSTAPEATNNCKLQINPSQLGSSPSPRKPRSRSPLCRNS